MAFRLLILTLVLGGSILLNICRGDVQLTPSEVWSYMAGNHSIILDAGTKDILWHIRLPRLLGA